MSDFGRELVILGASTRAAAFSALRAGLVPCCVDLFADRDLFLKCPAHRLQGRYPDAFRDALDSCPHGPWVYTGALENHPSLIAELEARRPLLGNGAEVLRRVRDPRFLGKAAERAGLPRPQVSLTPPSGTSGRWLVKPLTGAGGVGIRPWQPGEALPSRRCYWQEYIEGVPASALYAGNGQRAALLGVTRQLIGEPWLNAAPFHYCGSVGPLRLGDGLRAGLERFGEQLAWVGSLRGLFGVDGILSGGSFWPVELNPRYSASVEVVEQATGLRSFQTHYLGCLGQEVNAPAPVPATETWVGKAIYFAERDLSFPEAGPWQESLGGPVEALPAFADVPEAGEVIEAGHPVLTLFARGGSEEECLRVLREKTEGIRGLLRAAAFSRNA